jgi:3-hydroxyisobutyrate dehydrogenase-like beta-hydroxyacid dehydrogenase
VHQICIAGVVQGLAEAPHFAKHAVLDIDKLIATASAETRRA